MYLTGVSTFICLAATETELIRHICRAKHANVVGIEWSLDAFPATKVTEMLPFTRKDLFAVSDNGEEMLRFKYDINLFPYCSPYTEPSLQRFIQNLEINSNPLSCDNLYKQIRQYVQPHYDVFRGVSASFLETFNVDYLKAKMLFLAKGGSITDGHSSRIHVIENTSIQSENVCDDEEDAHYSLHYSWILHWAK